MHFGSESSARSCPDLRLKPSVQLAKGFALDIPAGTRFIRTLRSVAGVGTQPNVAGDLAAITRPRVFS